MDQEELKFTPYLRALWRRKWLIAITALAALAAGVAAAVLDDSSSEPESRFVAAATLSIEDQATPDGSDAVAALQLLTGGGGDGAQSVQTHIELLRSSAVMTRSVNKIREAAGLPEETDENLLNQAAEVLAEDVRVSQVSGSNLLVVSAAASDPETARLRTDSIVAAYQQFLRSQKLVATQDAIDAIDQRISDSSQPALTSTRLKIVVDQLSTSDLDRVERAISSSIVQLEGLDLSQFPDPPSLSGLLSELEAASARLETVASGIASLESELGTGPSAPLPGLESVETVQGLAASSLVTVREISSDFAEASLNADLSGGNADLTNANLTISTAANQLSQLSNNVALSLADRTTIAQLRDQLSAVQGSNAAVVITITNSLESGTASTADTQRILTQFNAAASSLQITLESLAQVRQGQSNTAALTQMVTVEGQLQAVITSLTEAALALDNRSELGPEADLAQLEDLLENAVERLDVITVRLGNPSGGQLLEAEVRSTAAVLESASQTTAILRMNQQLRIVTSSGELFSIEPQLNTAVSLMQGVAANLAAGSSLSNDVLIERLGRWSETTAEASTQLEELELQLAGLDTSGPADPILDALDKASVNLRDQGASLVSVGKIVDATSSAGVSSFVASRLDRFSSDLSEAAVIFSSSASQMTGTANTIRNLPAVIVTAALIDLQSAHADLVAATELVNGMQERAAAGELLTLTDAGDVASRLRLVQAELAMAAVEVAQVGATELDLTAQNVQSAEARLRTILAQLSGVEASEAAAIDDLFDVRRDLQISLLGPQETGVALVDTDVEEIVSGGDSSLPVDARVLLGAIGGLMLGLIAALALELMDRTVRRPEDIGDITRASSLGLLPQGAAKGNPHPPEVTDDPTSVFSEAVHLVATQIQGRVNDRSRLLLISSPGPREGKTMMAINLARALSLRSLKVLLVDANFRKPDASKIFEFADEPGLATALTQSRDPGEFIRRVEGTQLDVLPAGRSLVPPVELISRPGTGALLQKVRQQYDFVIIDGPPTLGFSESNALAKQAGAVVMVARVGSTKKSALREAMEDLSGTDVLGVVMNFVSRKDLSFLEHRDYDGGSSQGKWRSRLMRRPFPFSRN